MKRMKLTGAAAALSLILALSACGTPTATTTAATEPGAADTAAQQGDVTTAATQDTSGGLITPSVYTNADGSLDESNIDVSEETIKALEYIGETAPLLKQYFEKRNLVPLTYETTVITSAGEYVSNLYIKDSRHLVQYVKTPDGKITHVIYNFDTAYELDPAEKVAIFQNCGEGSVVETVRNSIVYIEEDEVKHYDYVTSEEEYEGTNYDCVTMTKAGEQGSIKYYFDKADGGLKYIVSPESVTRIDRLETVFDSDALLEVPADYTMKSINEVVGDIGSEIKSQIAESKAAEEAAQ
ncbi:MAG: hypothetical protein IJT87_11585 [Ruminiclostridium sp.]|nr:hypothetical protein [Ruminiclostridium sp.]